MALQVFQRGVRSGHAEYVDNASLNVEYGCVDLRFYCDRGFGESEYRVSIHPEHFPHLVEAILRANADEVIKAIGNVLKDGIPAPVLKNKVGTILSRRKPTPEEREG